jgi:hypothetical protein
MEGNVRWRSIFARVGLGGLALVTMVSLRPAGAGSDYVCPTVHATQRYTFAYGSVLLDGIDAPVGSVVEARSPRGDTVGCHTVESAGIYGLMFVYGEDPNPGGGTIPGMRAGEVVAFLVDGSPATSAPELAFADDWASHRSDLSAQSGISGDVNGDGAPNSTDALIILSADVGMNTSWFCPMNCGDVNSDGLVNSTDALIILSYDVGMTIPFPVGQAGCPSSVTQPAGCNP